MISIDQLNSASQEDFVDALGGIYELSPWVAERAWHQIPYSGRSNLVSTLSSIVDESTTAQKLTLLRSHPDLAGKLALEDKLTEESKSEQASLGLDRLSPENFEALSSLNERYQSHFGFPFIICVRLVKDLSELLTIFRERIEQSIEAEQETALQQVHAIARLRLEDLVSS